MWQNIKQFIELFAYAIISVIGIASVAGFFWSIRKKWWSIFKQLDICLGRIIAFMNEILPDILNGLENKNIIPEGTLASWAKIQSRDNTLLGYTSPLFIKPDGQKIIEDSGFSKIFKEHKNEFIDKIADKIQVPASKYDIEKFSIDLMAESFDKNPIFNPVKNYLFENPGFPKTTMITLTGLTLRDYIFNNQEMKQKFGL